MTKKWNLHVWLFFLKTPRNNGNENNRTRHKKIGLLDVSTSSTSMLEETFTPWGILTKVSFGVKAIFVASNKLTFTFKGEFTTYFLHTLLALWWCTHDLGHFSWVCPNSWHEKQWKEYAKSPLSTSKFNPPSLIQFFRSSHLACPVQFESMHNACLLLCATKFQDLQRNLGYSRLVPKYPPSKNPRGNLDEWPKFCAHFVAHA